MPLDRRTAWPGLLLALSLFAASGPAQADDPAENVLEPPPYEQFLVLPLRVHIFSATDLPEVDCHLKRDDITRIVGKVNGIWHKAGIHWALESLVHEPAARQEVFRDRRETARGGSLGLYRSLVPVEGRKNGGLHVYYLHKFPVNGVWLGDDFAIVQETAGLRKVEGGSDEPIPRVTAHELGHALDLPHRQNTTNLLASGTTGTLLNTHEVETARKAARDIKGFKTVAELKVDAADAEAAGNTSRARKLWTWLSQIPGCGDDPAASLKRLDR